MKSLQWVKSIPETIVEFGLGRTKTVMLLAALITVILGALMVRVQVDTDPENMLSSDDPVRVLNRSLKADFGTRDMIVLGIIDDSGVLNGNTLTRTSGLIDHIKTLDGVVPEGVVGFKSAANARKASCHKTMWTRTLFLPVWS